MTNLARSGAGSTPSRVTTGSNRRRLKKTIAGAAVAALLVSACTADEAQTLADNGAAASADTAVLPTVGGGQIDVNDLEGTDTILWFWAPW